MYQLNVDFNSNDLATLLEAGEKVTIVKQVSGGSSAQVAWVSFSPLQSNSVTWQDTYTMYASRTMLEGNATITMLAQAPADETQSLPFNNTGSFQSADPTTVLPADTFGVENQYTTTSALTFGLAQQANVSGTAVAVSPINASLVPMNQSATFEPLDVIQVFMQANTSNGMVLSQVGSSAITLPFGDGTNELTITYNSAIGGFTQN